MTPKENITAILECYFTGFKQEIIDSACNRILEQETCEDCISRQAVMDVLGDSINDDKDYHRSVVLLNNLPTVTPKEKTEWIPVIEMLPEKEGQYLVTVNKGYTRLGLWIGIKDDWKNVTAWMPLPEPYELQESENKE